jgi:hypothetical protein
MAGCSAEEASLEREQEGREGALARIDAAKTGAHLRICAIGSCRCARIGCFLCHAPVREGGAAKGHDWE